MCVRKLAPYSLAELQELARAYNHRGIRPSHSSRPRPCCTPSSSSAGCSKRRRRRSRSAWPSSSRRAVARKGAVWALKLEDQRRFEERRGREERRVVMAHELVEAEHELLKDAKTRLDGA